MLLSKELGMLLYLDKGVERDFIYSHYSYEFDSSFNSDLVLFVDNFTDVTEEDTVTIIFILKESGLLPLEFEIPISNFRNHLYITLDKMIDKFNLKSFVVKDKQTENLEKELIDFRKWQKENCKTIYLYSDDFMVSEYLKTKQ